MDAKRHSDQEYLNLLRTLYSKKFRDLQLGIIISSDDYALSFLLANRDYLFPGVPIVFCGVNDYTPETLAGQKKITGVVESFDIHATIEMALQLYIPRPKKLSLLMTQR